LEAAVEAAVPEASDPPTEVLVKVCRAEQSASRSASLSRMAIKPVNRLRTG
jgi:hypothetical protein